MPIHYLHNPRIHLRLKQHFGLAEDDEGSLCRLGVDLRGICPEMVGRGGEIEALSPYLQHQHLIQ